MAKFKGLKKTMALLLLLGLTPGAFARDTSLQKHLSLISPTVISSTVLSDKAESSNAQQEKVVQKEVEKSIKSEASGQNIQNMPIAKPGKNIKNKKKNNRIVDEDTDSDQSEISITNDGLESAKTLGPNAKIDKSDVSENEQAIINEAEETFFTNLYQINSSNYEETYRAGLKYFLLKGHISQEEHDDLLKQHLDFVSQINQASMKDSEISETEEVEDTSVSDIENQENEMNETIETNEEIDVMPEENTEDENSSFSNDTQEYDEEAQYEYIRLEKNDESEEEQFRRILGFTKDDNGEEFRRAFESYKKYNSMSNEERKKERKELKREIKKTVKTNLADKKFLTDVEIFRLFCEGKSSEQELYTKLREEMWTLSAIIGGEVDMNEYDMSFDEVRQAFTRASIIELFMRLDLHEISAPGQAYYNKIKNGQASQSNIT